MLSMRGRRAAVIGGSGFIGSHLAERLVTDGADVLAVARTEAGLSNLSGVRTACVAAMADVREAESMTRMLRRFRPEIVFFLASHPDAPESFRQMAECVQTNGLGLVNTLQAAASAGCEVFVYGDSAKDYGNAETPYRASQPVSPVCSYAISKAAGWQLCQLVASFTDLQAVALRPTLVYGPRQNRNIVTYVRDCVSAGRPVRLMGGAQTRDPLYIDDAVSAYIAAATRPAGWGHAIPVGGGHEVTVASLCEAVVAALGASVPVIPGAEEPRLTEIWRSRSDNADAARLLDWQPRVGLAEGLSRLVHSWRTSDRPAPGTVPSERPDSYLHASAHGGVYRMLDRREGPERRSAARGGRRVADVTSLDVLAGTHVQSSLAGVQASLAGALPFRTYPSPGGDTQ